MKPFVFFFFLAASFSLHAQTPTVKQLYDEYRKNKNSFEKKYSNQTLSVTGKIRSISVASSVWKDQDFHRIHLTATGYENFVVCQIPYKDSAILKQFKTGDFITVTGSVSSASDALYLTQCSFTSAQPATVKHNAPADAPLGRYDVYQDDGKGFNYQYNFTLKSWTAYTLNNEAGTCSYNSKTKVIKFITGPLKGFAGLYRPFTDNEKDPPGFLLDAKGTVPDAKGLHKGYQFGYFHQ